ncbi:MAG: metallophosphoesterase [Candidatus Thermoplasmatota archaeon]
MKKDYPKILTIFVIFILFFSTVYISEVTPFEGNKNNLKNSIKNDTSTIYFSSFNKENRIIYPRSSCPEIIEKNDNFTIIFQIKKLTKIEDIEIGISTAYKTLEEKYFLPILDTHKNNSRWNIKVKITSEIPEELYNLTISILSKNKKYKLSCCRGIKVVDEITDDFTFIHLTDFHIGDPRGLKENFKQTLGNKAAKKCLKEINLLKPDFVIITGDLVFGQLYPFEYSIEYKKFYNILQDFKVPTFLCPGNHDGYFQTFQDGFNFWNRYFGPLYYSFNYGDSHLTMINSYDWNLLQRTGFFYVVLNWGGSIQEDQLRWIENDLNRTQSNLKMIFMHHNPLWNTKKHSLLRNDYQNRKKILSLIEEYNVDAVFSGHVHYDNVTTENDTMYITTTTASSSLKEDAYWGYRYVEVKNGTIESVNYKEPKYSISSYRINYSYINDNKAFIENDLEKNITAHLSFVLPNEEYYVENGEIYNTRIKNNKKEVYVRAEVPANSNLTVELLSK